MVKTHRVQLSIDGRSIVYEGDPAEVDLDGADTPLLIIEVDDFNDAQEIVETLDRSRARKSAVKKEPAKNGHGEEPPASSAPPPDPKPRAVPEPCEATGCVNEGKPREDSGGTFCDDCTVSLGATMRKQLHKSWLKAQGEKAQKIREDIERRPDPPPVPKVA